MLTGALGFTAGIVVYRLLRGKNLLTNDSGWISTPSVLGWIVLLIVTPFAWVVHKLKRLVFRG